MRECGASDPEAGQQSSQAEAYKLPPKTRASCGADGSGRVEDDLIKRQPKFERPKRMAMSL